MATSTESYRAVKDVTAAKDPKESKGLSSLDEMNLERSILRRGLATVKTRSRLCQVAPGQARRPRTKRARGLLEIMVAARVLTENQSKPGS